MRCSGLTARSVVPDRRSFSRATMAARASAHGSSSAVSSATARASAGMTDASPTRPAERRSEGRVGRASRASRRS